MPTLRETSEALRQSTVRWRRRAEVMPSRAAVSPATSEQARRAFDANMQDVQPMTMEEAVASIESMESPTIAAEVEHDLRYFVSGRKPRVYKQGDCSKLGWSVTVDYANGACRLKLGRWGSPTQAEAVAKALASHASERRSNLREMNNLMDTTARLNKMIGNINELAASLAIEPASAAPARVTREVSTDELASMGYLPPDVTVTNGS